MYEWDQAKRESNLKKHGLDFVDAYLVYENPAKITLRQSAQPEERRMDVALVEVHGVVLALIYTMRGTHVRCISFRVASRKERRMYEEIKG